MKKLLFATCLVTVGLLSCNQKSAQPADQKTEAAPAAEAPKKIELKLAQLATDQDFICGMPLEEGSIGDTTTYEGKIYGFCSTECKTEFLKNPSSYVSKLKK